MKQKRVNISFWADATLNSYSQIFYSLNKPFAVIILIVTFFSPVLGLAGLSGVLFTNLIAYGLGFNTTAIREGIYGFGALLLSLALSFEYTFNGAFTVLFLVALFMQLVVAVLFSGFFGKHGLPVLSFPFIITYWIVFTAASAMQNIHVNELNAYVYNQEAHLQNAWHQLALCMEGIALPHYVAVYFKTLSATFFVNGVFPGVLIAVGLLFFSRIAFSLSVLGFVSAVLFYSLFGASIEGLTYHLVGSNFIFMSIGIGCFYLVPSIWSYLSVIALTPILVMLVIFLSKTLGVVHLKPFTLSFSIITTAFLYALHQRWLHKFLQLVVIQYYSAEKTIYKHVTHLSRFKHAHLAKLSLPFWGEWQVSQGYNGKITHLGNWSKALDFVIVDDTEKTYRSPGIEKSDFYCYNKPVTAPLDGYVYEIINTVDDNEITDVDTQHNWGNTIVLNHLNGLFSQISHIKKDSFKVSVGDFVNKGSILAACGNSGRSPEPHIHFQLQTSPKVGAETLAYPIAYFIERYKGNSVLKMYEVPLEGSMISNVEVNSMLLEAFNLKPGQKLMFKNEKSQTVQWEIFTDAWNRRYIYCHTTKSYAYFVCDQTMFYFTDFEGSKRSFLFEFYCAACRLLLATYKNIPIHDQIPLYYSAHGILRWVHDFTAPIFMYAKTEYTSGCMYTDEDQAPKTITMASSVKSNWSKKVKEYKLTVKENKLQQIQINHKEKTETWDYVY